MEIVVNDTNIFIDLWSVDFLDDFFRLPLEVHTLDFVVNELKQDEQRNAIKHFIDSGRLYVKSLDVVELQQVLELQMATPGNLSTIDCAVWKYAKDNGFALLTGDRQLRNKAIDSGVPVRGILYVFDQLVDNNVITPARAIEKLQALFAINSRLPKNLIEERIERWRRNQKWPKI